MTKIKNIIYTLPISLLLAFGVTCPQSAMAAKNQNPGNCPTKQSCDADEAAAWKLCDNARTVWYLKYCQDQAIEAHQACLKKAKDCLKKNPPISTAF